LFSDLTLAMIAYRRQN